MNWYKKANSTPPNYIVWLTKELRRLTNDYTQPLPAPYNTKDLEVLKNWVFETRPNLSELSIEEAIEKASSDKASRSYSERNPYDPQEIKRNMNRYFAETQSYNPKATDFAVDIRLKGKAIPPKIRKAINEEIYNLGNYHTEIPLGKIFEICEKNNVIALQEDGTKWSGFLVGGAECGSEEARNQIAHFDLAVKQENGFYIPAENVIALSWCKMSSGRYEIVCYVS